MCHCGKYGILGKIAFAFIIIGALNWGLFGIFGFDLVAAIFGSMSVVARIVYILVGVAAVYKLAVSFCKCKAGCCKDGKCCDHSMGEKQM